MHMDYSSNRKLILLYFISQVVENSEKSSLYNCLASFIICKRDKVEFIIFQYSDHSIYQNYTKYLVFSYFSKLIVNRRVNIRKKGFRISIENNNATYEKLLNTPSVCAFVAPDIKMHDFCKKFYEE